MNRRLFLGGAGTLLVAGTAAYVLWPMQQSAAGGVVFTGGTEGVAINGYDPVAYFTENRPVEGSAAHTERWNGVIWRFASAENRDLFAADPEKYAPQYGGYCAFAAAKNQFAKTEPDAFTVHEGKLYLNYDQGIKRRWDGDKEAFIEAANGYWPGLVASKAE